MISKHVDCKEHTIESKDDTSDKDSSASEVPEALDFFDNAEIEDESDTEKGLAYSLFDGFSASEAEPVWKHMKELFNFDLLQFSSKSSEKLFDDYKRIKLTNYLRQQQKEKRPIQVQALLDDWDIWDREENLLPAFENDRLLWELPLEYTLFDDTNSDDDEDKIRRNMKPEDEVEFLKKRVEELTSQLERLRYYATAEDSNNEGRHTKTIKASNTNSIKDQHYFNSYSQLDIHRQMILDYSRTSSYQMFISNCKELIKGKVVLDIGCGSGILSMFCAQAGARLVVGIDAAAGILSVAKSLIQKNNFQDKIQLFEAKLEESNLWFSDGTLSNVEVTPRDALPLSTNAVPFKADIIVSEWMGYCLLYEAMLFTVIDARDRFLKDDGFIIPSKSSMQIWAADFSDKLAKEVDIWDTRMFGLDLTDLKPDTHRCFTSPETTLVEESRLVSNPYTFIEIDLKQVEQKDLISIRRPILLRCKAIPTSIVFSFSCEFNTPYDTEKNNTVVLDTGPVSSPTHWNQTLCHFVTSLQERSTLFPCMSDVIETGELLLNGYVSLIPHADNFRHLYITFELQSISTKGKTISRNKVYTFELQ